MPRLKEINTSQGFHSISFPSEWGLGPRRATLTSQKVSIQLVSPASGDPGDKVRKDCCLPRFHSISFPSEWGPSSPSGFEVPSEEFPFN